ncbi:MAG: chemotaxis protein CheW, partial [Verrucomicrobiota bacterium]
DRRGALWMERFKSVLVEDGEALRTMAAYIDLNAVRAGMVKDPKDYRWCGYGEAMGGGKAARLGLCHVVGHGERGEAAWDTPAVPKGMNATEVYRCWLFDDAGRPTETAASLVNKAGILTETVVAEKQRQGKLSRTELLRSRVRCFSDGLVIGSKPFVEGVFAEHRSQFSPGRKSGARTLREYVNGSLFTARQLTVRALG